MEALASLERNQPIPSRVVTTRYAARLRYVSFRRWVNGGVGVGTPSWPHRLRRGAAATTDGAADDLFDHAVNYVAEWKGACECGSIPP